MLTDLLTGDCDRISKDFSHTRRLLLEHVRIHTQGDGGVAVPEPVYRQIAAIIRAQIQSGELPPDKRIPTEKDLVDLYGVARTTARRAIKVLRDEHLIYTVPQRGSYVSPR